jgi:hypothetical protein
MSDGTKFARMMREAGKIPASELAGIVVGTVTSISPLKIRVDKIELTETFLIRSPLVIEKKITVATEEIKLWRGLQAGDKVYLLRLDKGQKFYILQRKEGLV